MKKFLSFFKGFIPETILAPLFKLLEACNDLIVPLIVAKIIDDGIPAGDKTYIIKMCALLVGLGVVGLVIALTAQYFAAKSATGHAKRTRSALMGKIQELNFKQLDEIGTSTLVNTMTEDVVQVQTGINLVLRLFSRSPFIVFGAVIFALILDIKAGLVFAVMLPCLAIAVFTVLPLGIKKFTKAREQADQVLLSARENIYGVREVRAFCKEQSEIEKFNARNEQLNRKNIKSANLVGLLNPLTFAIINVAVICMIYTGAIRVSGGVFGKGVVVALYNYMTQILVELVKLANLTVNVSKSVASWKRIDGILSVKTERDISVTERQNLPFITVKDLSFSYGGSKNALEGISFAIEKGERLGIIGGTGSGKSTLASLIYKGYSVKDGMLFINGKDVNSYSEEELRDSVALVGQKAVLFKGTIRDNMLFGNPSASDQDILSALSLACCDEILEAHGGLDGAVSEGGKNFSGGQRQRLTIARALVKNAPILILDDSFSALDYATERKLIDNLKNTDYTIILITQRISSLGLADKILVLENGAIDGLGIHDELIISSPVYKEILSCKEAL